LIPVDGENALKDDPSPTDSMSPTLSIDHGVAPTTPGSTKLVDKAKNTAPSNKDGSPAPSKMETDWLVMLGEG
jgi:hypothetical protein